MPKQPDNNVLTDNSGGPARLNAADPGFELAFEHLLSLKRETDADVATDVTAIINDVRANGDEALFRLTAQFDQVALDAYTIIIVVLIGFLVTIAFVLITVAARYIPAAEISLILPLETVGGIALAWWLLDEVPGYLTLWGAAIILLALSVHSYFMLQKSR